MRYQGVALAIGAGTGAVIALSGGSALAVGATFFFIILIPIVLKDPGVVVPLLFITLPLEISKKYIPVLRIDKGLDGQDLSMLELSRIIVILGVAVAFLTGSFSKMFRLARYGMAKWSLLLFAFCCLQLVSVDTDPHRASIEIIRLGALILSMFVTAAFLTSMERVRVALRAFVVSGAIIALLGIWQYYTRDFFWNFNLGNASTPRINVTFADPNILGRYLAVLILVALGTMETHLVKSWQLWLALLTGAASLLFTYSRSSWFALLSGMLVISWYSKGKVKLRMIQVGVALLLGVALMFIAVPPLRARIQLLVNDPNYRMEGRSELIKTAVEIYKDHPFVGVGLGAFSVEAKRDYSAYLPYHGFYVTKSHTAMFTVMAELGTVGLVITTLLLKSSWDSMTRVLRSPDKANDSYALSCFVAILAIVISAQSEGGMLEDLMLWMFMGMLLGIERLVQEEKHVLGDENSAGFFNNMAQIEGRAVLP